MVTINLYSSKKNEISKFLSQFYNTTSFDLEDQHKWQKDYTDPIEIAEVIGTLIDNSEEFSIHMWISLDKDFYIYVTEKNADELIRYLYERFPY